MSYQKIYFEIAEKLIHKIEQANLKNEFPESKKLYSILIDPEHEEGKPTAFDVLKALDSEFVYNTLSHYLVSYPNSIEEIEESYRLLTDLQFMSSPIA